MRQWFSASELLLAATAAALVCAGTTLFLDKSTTKTSADDWRRTVSGWERVSDWQVAEFKATFAPSRGKAAKVGRYDTHPAVVALAQMTAVIVALWIFGPGRRRQNATAPSLKARIAQSFRASAFGS